MAKQLWDYPKHLDLARLSTPLQPLDRFTAAIHKDNPNAPRVWIKRDDLTGCAESGNKIRKLEFLLAEALEQQASVVITCGGIQSNHCRATALLSARLGLQCHLLLRGKLPELQSSSGNLMLSNFCGAQTSFYSKSDFQKNIDTYFDQWSEHYKQQGKSVFCIPTGGSNATGVWGYIKACEELAHDFTLHEFVGRTAILTAAGSGGTQAGLLAGSDLFALQADIFGVNVCDDEAWFINKIHQDLNLWAEKFSYKNNSVFFDAAKKATPKIIDGYVGRGYAKADQAIFDLIAQLAAGEGIVLDPVYTGKAFYGLQQELIKGYFNGYENLVFIHTGGIFGLFADDFKLQII